MSSLTTQESNSYTPDLAAQFDDAAAGDVLEAPRQVLDPEVGNIALQNLLATADDETPTYQLGVELGLYVEPPKIRDGWRANTIEVPRVVGFGGPQGTQEAGLVKIKTLVDEAKAGAELEAQLQEEGVVPKDRNAYRIFRGWMRVATIDELPNVMVNVLGFGTDLYDKPLKLNWLGAGRPPMAEELEYRGVNANDEYRKALEIKTRQHNLSSADEMHRVAGLLYSGPEYMEGKSDGTYTSNAGLTSWATYQGTRQLRDKLDYVDWITGLEYYDYLQKLPLQQRRFQELRLVAKTALHVVLGTDAA